ncbi:MAG: nitrite reductase [Comamonas sp.]|uniref:nitrite reductase n=1 Tax=Comamonas sp. TaxID=34028 RepID=UPI002FC885BC
MTPDIKVQGWCPTAWQPMRAQDGWMVRVRPHCAALSAAQWRVLADLALAHAHPQIELTRLGNVQLRGVGESELETVRARLIAARLVPEDADADLAPAVHCTPLYAAGDATHALARALSLAAVQRLSPQALARQGLAALPGKFGLLVDDPARRMQATGADLQLWVSADRGYGLALADSTPWYCFAQAEQAVDAAVEIAAWFAAERMALAPAPTRLRALLAHRTPPLPALQMAPWRAAGAGFCAALAPGLHSGHGRVIAAPLGRIAAAEMSELAAQLPADAEIRVTPWRSLLLPWDAMAPAAPLDAAHWITQADDVRLRVSACTGAPRCAQGHAPAQTLALALAAQVPPETHLHVSGCAKCCALSADATAVIVARLDAGGAPRLDLGRADQRSDSRTPISWPASTDAPANLKKLLHDLYL